MIATVFELSGIVMVGVVLGFLMVGLASANDLPPREGQPEREGESKSAAKVSAGPLCAPAGECVCSRLRRQVEQFETWN
jgi:hypothetical protein